MFNNITESWKVLHQNYQFLWSGEHSQNLIVDLLLFQKKYRTGETIFVNVVLTKSLFNGSKRGRGERGRAKTT